MVELSDFSQELQNIIMFNFESWEKSILFFSIMAFSLFYALYWKPNVQKKTVFYSVSIIRTILLVFSWAFIIGGAPYSLFLTPELSFWEFVYMYGAFYFTVLLLFLALVGIDIFYFFPQVLLRAGGLNIGDERVRKIWNRYFKRTG